MSGKGLEYCEVHPVAALGGGGGGGGIISFPRGGYVTKYSLGEALFRMERKKDKCRAVNRVNEYS